MDVIEQPVGEIRERLRRTLNGEPMTAAQLASMLGVSRRTVTTTLSAMLRAGEAKVAGFGLRNGRCGRIPLTFVRAYRQ